MRKYIFPSIIAAYEDWHRTGNRAELLRVCKVGEMHWGTLCQRVMTYVERHPSNFTQPLVDLIENSRL